MALNLNVFPYFDDTAGLAGADLKNYNRILFKPGYAVQARELTQLQSVLQGQIGKFGNKIFTNGSVISGCEETFDTRLSYVKIIDQDSSGNELSNDLSAYVGDELVSPTGMKAVIVDYVPGNTSSQPDLKTFYLRYVSGDNSDYSHFWLGETLEVESTNSGRNGDTFVVDSTYGLSGTSEYDAVGHASVMSIKDGLIYFDDKFAYFSAQNVVISKYANKVTGVVGFELEESIVSAEEDQTLLDPAQGTFNYLAPGADRLKLTLNLKFYRWDETPPANFAEYLKIQAGEVLRKKDNNNIYADIYDMIATRTFEESGNYTVKAPALHIREHLNDGSNYGVFTAGEGGDARKLWAGVEASTFYVGGRRHSPATTTPLVLYKGVDNVAITDLPLTFDYGNYVEVNQLAGVWSISAGTLVTLYDEANTVVTDGTFSNSTVTGTAIGTARVRQLVYVSGTPGAANAVYRMYLYDVTMTTGAFSDVGCVYYNNGTAKGFADVISGTLVDSNYDRSLIRFPFRALKTTKPDGTTFNNNFLYTKEIDGQIDTNGSITLNVSGKERFQTGTSGTFLKENYIMVLGANVTLDGTLRYKGEFVNLSSATATVGGGGTSLTIDLPGTASAITAVKVYANISVSNGDPTLKQLRENIYVKVDTATAGASGTYPLGFSDVYRIVSIKMGASSALYETIAASGQDVTSEFLLDTGQTDTLYKTSKIVKKATSSLGSLANKKLVIKLDYFTHDGNSPSGTFFTIDSYPIDDTGVAAGTIKTQDIPTYLSPTTKETYDLRDVLDYRGRIADTASRTTVLADASENPTVGTALSTPVVGYTSPVVNTDFTTDVSYYLARQDRIVVGLTGEFRVITGTSSITPVVPVEPENTMTVATVYIPPYPSLSAQAATLANRSDYTVSSTAVENRRYTMRDIGALEKRINRLEYYASLSLLEQSAASMTVPDANGLDRFKNGILVDSFMGHNIGNVYDGNYHCAIDPINRELRPYFNLENIDVNLNWSKSAYVRKTGDLLTLPYVETEYMANNSYSKIRNCVSELLFDYMGDISMDPPDDNWFDTTAITPSQINIEGTADAWNNLADAWGTQWGDWSTNWTGEETTRGPVTAGTPFVGGDGRTVYQSQTQQVTTTRTGTQTRAGTQLDVSTSTIPQTQTTGARVVDVSVIPYMRSKVITFKAKRLKPNTRVYPFFDGMDVSAHCRPISTLLVDYQPEDPTSGYLDASFLIAGKEAYGSTLVSDSEGVVCGHFLIPENTFKTGSKIFRLVDDKFNRSSFTTTWANVTFTASGFNQTVQDTVVSTRQVQLAVSTVNDSENLRQSSTVESRLGDRVVGTLPPPPPPPPPTVIYVEQSTTPSPVVTSTPGPTPSSTVNVPTSTTTTAGPTSTTTTAGPSPSTTTTTTGKVQPPVQPPPSTTPDPCATVEVCSPPWTETITSIEYVDVPDVWRYGSEIYGGFYPWAETVQAPPKVITETVTHEGICTQFNPCEVATIQIGPFGFDPIAQTFFVSGMKDGMFVTSLDLRFQSKSTTMGVTVQLREVENGYPSNRVIPFAEKFLAPSDVDVSEDGTALTSFVFPSPVYLKTETEYCFVVLPQGNSPDYNLWVSELGENQYNTNTRISQQPNAGVLFTSANNRTWTAWQSEDISFQLNRASFSIGLPGVATFSNYNTDYLKLADYTNGYFNPGDAIYSYNIQIEDGGTGYSNATVSGTLTGGNGTGATVAVTISGGSVTNVVVTNPGIGYTTAPTGISFTSGSPTTVASFSIEYVKGIVKEVNTFYGVAEVSVMGSVAFVAGNRITNNSTIATISEIQDKKANLVRTNVASMSPNSTELNWGLGLSQSADTAGPAGLIGMIKDQDLLLPAESYVRSYSNELEVLGGNKSTEFSAVFGTRNEAVSPVIDMKKNSLIIVRNDINNDATNETSNRGNAASRYISRNVILEDGQDAEDMKIYLSSLLPAGTDVKVYGKFRNVDDATALDDIDWIELEREVEPTVASRKTQTDYVYNIPDAYKNGDNVYTYNIGSSPVTGFKTFAVKIVPLSDNTSVIPVIKDFRAIALQRY